MPMFDLPLEQLRAYRSRATAPDDLAAFWRDTLSEARAHDSDVTMTRHDAGLELVEVHDVAFAGFGGHRIRAWLLTPRHHSGALPCVVEYCGYDGGRGLPLERLAWVAAGHAHVVMDTRGQGSGWQRGDTPDPWPAGGPHIGGFMTLGIGDRHDYYYRRVYTDAVRAVDAARTLPCVDPERIIVTGGSQGGGITLAVAGLVDGLVAALPDVPFLCDIRHATELVETDPYNEIVRYLRTHRDKVEETFHTLSYFDAALLCRTATAPALFSLGLMDDTCPPSTVYAAVNNYGGSHEVREFAYNKHEGGGAEQRAEQLAFVRRVLGAGA